MVMVLAQYRIQERKEKTPWYLGYGSRAATMAIEIIVTPYLYFVFLGCENHFNVYATLSFEVVNHRYINNFFFLAGCKIFSFFEKKDTCN